MATIRTISSTLLHLSKILLQYLSFIGKFIPDNGIKFKGIATSLDNEDHVYLIIENKGGMIWLQWQIGHLPGFASLSLFLKTKLHLEHSAG
ncbi:MAG: hypothetical protein KBB67_04985 [Syntrophorhabdus sp.]|nr:hypothetical protein [Syntrophorhabdus sp.]